jgi:hypothetical protein
VIYDRVEKKGKFYNLPYDSEVHFTDDGLIYFLNLARIFVPDLTTEIDNEYALCRVLRPEFQFTFSSGEPDNNYILVTWQNPVPCSECGEIITDYDYFYYEKRSLDK